MPKIEEAIEVLQCAEINCDNIKRLGTFFADAVKQQIQDAIKLLEGDEIRCMKCDKLIAYRMSGDPYLPTIYCPECAEKAVVEEQPHERT